MTNQEFVSGLRNVADFFETHPELKAPYEVTRGEKLTVGFFGEITDDLDIDSKEGAAAFVRIVGGRIKKDANDSHLILVADKGSFAVRAVASRDALCERVQTGTRIVPATEETFIPAQPEREEPVYEWRCNSILAPEV